MASIIRRAWAMKYSGGVCRVLLITGKGLHRRSIPFPTMRLAAEWGLAALERRLEDLEIDLEPLPLNTA